MTRQRVTLEGDTWEIERFVGGAVKVGCHPTNNVEIVAVEDVPEPVVQKFEVTIENLDGGEWDATTLRTVIEMEAGDKVTVRKL